MAAHAFPLFRTFARDTRGAAGIELGFGAVALLTIAMLCFDLYSLVRVNTAGARSAVAMAEYVSREATPDGDQMAALGRFLHRQEFGAPADVVYVVSAVHRPPGGNPAEVLWADDTIRFGAAGTTETLAGECTRRGTAGWRTALLGNPETSGMVEGEVAIVAEVCARPMREGMLTSRFVSGDIYRLYILPSRDRQEIPAQPVYSMSTEGTDTTSPFGGGVLAGAGVS